MTEETDFRILELFSGIGGMHTAFKMSQLPGEVVAAIDINTVANTVYAHNHPNVQLAAKNIQSITPNFVDKLNVNTILMSPPCQPFTRVGNQKDIDDNRTNALVHLCKILPDLKKINMILMENVKGFETSKARDLYLNVLKTTNFKYQEFILSPSQFDIPNTRYRYYCLARRNQFVEFPFKSDQILEVYPNTNNEINNFNTSNELSGRLVKDFIINDNDEQDNDENFILLPDKLLAKRAKVLDVACPESTRTMCFTKAYTHYTEGTGSVFCPKSKLQVNEIYERIKIMENDLDIVDMLKTLKMRYFTPTEVARFMCFPIVSDNNTDVTEQEDTFSFPKTITTKQKYRLLGNSINVFVVSKLIRLFIEK